jgi:DNA-binding NtrC family response regulator
MKTRFEEIRTRANEFSAKDFHRFQSLHAESRTILFISNDSGLHERLRSLANETGLMVVKQDRAVGTAEILQVVKPSAVLLDLDLPDEAAWNSADMLLNEPDCPAIILLTGRTGHLAMQNAIHAGLLVSKGDSPDRLLQIIEEVLEMPGPHQAHRNALRRELIRWLRPPAWETESGSAYRFWGINE